jgi:hypothetical protein
MTVSATISVRSVAMQLWVGTAVALAIAVGWSLLAVTHPTTTYHFDPLFVVIAPVALARIRSTAPLPWRIVLAGSGIGAGLALATTVLLDGAGVLRGPTLIGSIGPVTEALIVIMFGVAIEVVSTLLRVDRSAH